MASFDFSNVSNRTLLEAITGNARKLDQLIMKADQLAGALASLKDQLGKSSTEITTLLAELRASLANVELPAEAVAKFEELKAAVQAQDDIVPDAPAPETPPA